MQVIFHLQTRPVPILPPICQLFGLAPNVPSRQRPQSGGKTPSGDLLRVSIPSEVGEGGGKGGEVCLTSVLKRMTYDTGSHSFIPLTSWGRLMLALAGNGAGAHRDG